MKKYILLFIIISQNITNASDISQNILNEFNEYYKARTVIVKKYPGAKEGKIQYFTGIKLFKKGLYSNALKRFMDVVYRYKKSKYRGRAAIFVAKCYVALNQYIFAEKEIKLYLEKNPEASLQFLFYYYRGIAAFKQSRFKAALKYFKTSVDKARVKSIKNRSRIWFSETLLKLNKRIKAYKVITSVLDNASSLNKKYLNKAQKLKRKIKWQYLMNVFHQDKSISHIYNSGKKVFILTWINGIAVFDRNKGKVVKRYKKENGLISNLVRHMKEDNGSVWVCTYAGLAVYNKKTKKWRAVRQKGSPKYTLKAVEISDKYIWIGTLTKGLYRYNKIKRKWKRFHRGNGSPGNAVVGLKLYGNKLWIATLDGGIGYFNEKTNKWKNYARLMSRNARDIKCLEVNKKYVFFGTFKHGVFVYEKSSGKWKRYTKGNSPLTSDNVLSMKLIRGYLYIGTYNGGVTKINLRGPSWKWSKMDLTHGLPSMDITYIEKEKGFIWFGTIHSGVGVMVNID